MKKYFIKTFGCQANKADSEGIVGWYEKRGWKKAKTINEADEVVINTCSVRQSAEDRVFGLVRNLTQEYASAKADLKGRKVKVILTGCILYHGKRWLKKKFPLVSEFRKTEEFIDGSKYAIRESKVHAWVPIMEGCNNFCTYCVVPYARGREKSRPFEEIICEVKRLARQGYKKITLLGQNVNSYGKEIKNVRMGMQKFASQNSFGVAKLQLKVQNYQKKFKTPFALLLATLHDIPGIKKISFITSNPWDLTDDIIEAIALPKIDRCLHLPVQSGDDKILQKMNRRYTAKQYLNLIKKIRAKIPDIKISTDIIVGFPGESKKQFQNTVNLCKKVGFEKAYIAMYSPRPMTTAFKSFKDDVPYQEKKRRWRVLEELINQRFSQPKVPT